MQEFQPLCRQLSAQHIDACQVATWSSKAFNKTESDGVFGSQKDDGDGCGCRPGCWGSAYERNDCGDFSPDQFIRQFRQSIGLIFGPAIQDRDVLAFDIAG